MKSLNNTGSKVYFENLNALRFIAASAVMGEHITRYFYQPDDWFKNAFIILLSADGTGAEVGVSFFFVLSGFLITYLLIEEYRNTGDIYLKLFYIRRSLRIWPLYFFTLIIGFVIHPALDPSLQEMADWKMYMAFLTNFDHIYFGWPQSGILGVQWSLAIEEQFYLLWPPVLYFLFRHRNLLLATLLFIILCSFLYKINGGHKYHTLSCLGGLTVGSLIAYISNYHLTVVHNFFSNLNKFSTLIIYVCGAMLIFFKYKISLWFPAYNAVTVVLFPIFSAFIVLDQNYSPHSFFKVGRLRLFSFFGRISYGIYLLHMVAITIVLYLVSYFDLSFWLATAGIFILTVLLSVGSYHFIELPFLKLRDNFYSKSKPREPYPVVHREM